MASSTNYISGNQTNIWTSFDVPQAPEQVTDDTTQAAKVATTTVIPVTLIEAVRCGRTSANSSKKDTGEYTEQPERIRCSSYISQPYMVIHKISDLQHNEHFKALLGTIKIKLHKLKGVAVTYIVNYGSKDVHAQDVAEFHTKEYCVDGTNLQQQQGQPSKILSLNSKIELTPHPRMQTQNQTVSDNNNHELTAFSKCKLVSTSEILSCSIESQPKTLLSRQQLVVDMSSNARCDAVVYIKDSEDNIERAKEILAKETDEEFKVEFNFLVNGFQELTLIEFFAKSMELELNKLRFQERQSRGQCLIV